MNRVTLPQAINIQDGQMNIESPNAAQACINVNTQISGLSCGSPETDNSDDGSSSNQGGQSGGGTDSGDSAEPTTAPGSGKGGLTTGAKAGIGVGVALGVLLLLAVAFFLFRRRSRRNRSNRNARSMGLDTETKAQSTSDTATSPTGYSKVPSEMRTEEVGAAGGGQRPVSSLMDETYNRVSEEQPAVGRGRSMSEHGRNLSRGHAVELEEQQGERFEMEEQQGVRHEMDARSLPDIDMDDESPERRSLEDIERSRNSGTVLPGQAQGGRGPVSPID